MSLNVHAENYAVAKHEGYQFLKVIATGELAGLLPFFFTVGLVVGIDKYGYRTRFCFKTAKEALASLVMWDGLGDPPGHWIKEKARGRDRHNPRVFFGIPVVIESRNPAAAAAHTAPR